MIQIMLHSKSILVFVCLLLSSIDACNIWKASDCPAPPTADDEEIVRDRSFFFCSPIH